MVRTIGISLLVLSSFLLARQQDSVLNTGDPAPNFFLRLLDGGEFYSRDYYGQPRDFPRSRKERNPTVISFFATWCGPCRKEIPELERLQERYPGIKFFLVNVAENGETLAAYLKTNPVRLPVLMDRYGKTAERFRVMDPVQSVAVLPTLVMIRKNGTVHFFKKGYSEGDEAKIEEQLLAMVGSD